MSKMFGMNDDRQALTWAAAFLLGVSLGRWIGQWKERRRRRKPRLKDIVEESGLFEAAWRAVETMELEGKICDDDLAANLAGQDKLARALSQAEPLDSGVRPPPGRRLYKISRFSLHSFWFDRQIMTALTSPAVPASKGWLSSRLRGSFSARGPSAPPRQVVVIGSGMDSRPWRLPLPPGCSWFEVDQENVIKFKMRALRSAGAQLPDSDTAATIMHPMRCQRWTGISVDLVEDEWLEKLIYNGFEPEHPTVWVIEGVLMYLHPSAAQQVLATAAEAAAPGSTLILYEGTEELLNDLETEALDRRGSISARKYQSKKKSHDNMNGNNEFVPSTGIEDSIEYFPTELVKQWKSGLPREPASILEPMGWVQQSITTPAAVSYELCGGAPEGKCAFETKQNHGSDRHFFFYVGRKSIP